MSTAATFELTRFTAHSPSRLSKAFRLENGRLVKESGGQLFDGAADRIAVDFAGFAALLDSLTPRQALAYGVNGHESARVVPAAKLPTKPTTPPTIARDRRHFNWSDGLGVLMLDYDPPPNERPLDRESLLQEVSRGWPALVDAPHLWRPSAGGCIHRSDTGEELKGVSGQRLYVLIANAADATRAGSVLFDRLWLAGFGRFEVSKSGALLSRTIIDGSVFQPERLDFCGGADCGPGLEQRLPQPLVLNTHATPVNTAETLPDLTSQEAAELRAIRERAAAALAGDVSRARETWIDDRVSTALDAIPAERRHEERARMADTFRRACEDGRLLADFSLEIENHGSVTVAAVLDNPARYHGCRTLDPLEPDYSGGRFTGWLNLHAAGKPYLYSHAHGGKRFSLHRALQTIRVEGGELHRMAEKALALIRLDGVIYQRGHELARLSGDQIQSVGADWLTVYLTRLCRFEKHDKRAKVWESVDCPARLATSICAMAGEWNLPILRAVVSAPFILATGRVVEADGYDAESGLYLDFTGAEYWEPIPTHPTLDQIKDAARELWRPFAKFPFTGPVDRGVFMAAILTAIQRPILPTAPGFTVDAPAAGSGKSLLAKCLSILAGVPTPEAMPPIKQGDDSEVRKRLFAACRAGARVILFDNATGQVESPALCAFMTAEVFSDRILGASEIGAAPTTAMVLFTGNNISMVGDLNRRMLRARIDAEIEAPHRRKFDLNPSAYVQEHRLKMVRAGLIVLRGYLHASAAPTDSMASFEMWSDLIRGAVVWLGRQLDKGGEPYYGDPAASIDDTYDQDPERTRLGALLAAWNDAFGSRAMTIREASREADMRKEINPDFFDALDEISGGRGNINGKTVRWYLERMAGRIVNDLRFRRGPDDKHAKQARWLVESVKNAGLAGLCGVTHIPRVRDAKVGISCRGAENNHAYTRYTRKVDTLAEELATLANLDVAKLLAGDFGDSDWTQIATAQAQLSERHPDAKADISALLAKVDAAYSARATP